MRNISSGHARAWAQITSFGHGQDGQAHHRAAAPNGGDVRAFAFLG